LRSQEPFARFFRFGGSGGGLFERGHGHVLAGGSWAGSFPGAVAMRASCLHAAVSPTGQCTLDLIDASYAPTIAEAASCLRL
jgi:hypothetical protein